LKIEAVPVGVPNRLNILVNGDAIGALNVTAGLTGEVVATVNESPGCPEGPTSITIAPPVKVASKSFVPALIAATNPFPICAGALAVFVATVVTKS